MHKTVLIIENTESDYNLLSNTFKSHGWEILPKTFSEIEKFWYNEKSDKEKLKTWIKTTTNNNYKHIGLVTLDISLYTQATRDDSDKLGLKEILPLIRGMSFIDFTHWGNQVPIIAVSKWSDTETIRDALTRSDFVNTYVIKSEILNKPEILIYKALPLYSMFLANSSKITSIELPKHILDQLSEVTKKLESSIDSNVLLQDKIDEIKFSLDKNLKASISSFNILLNSLDAKQSSEFINDFSEEIEEILGNEKYEEFTKKNKATIKDLLNSSFDRGSFSHLFEVVQEFLNHTGTTDVIPGGKFALFAISKILKILEK